MPRVVEQSVRTLIYTLHKQGKDVAEVRLSLAHISPPPTRATIKKVIEEETVAQEAGSFAVKNRRGPKQSTLEKTERVRRLLVDDDGRTRTNYEIARLMNDHPTTIKHCMQLIKEQEDSTELANSTNTKTSHLIHRRQRPEFDSLALERAVSPAA